MLEGAPTLRSFHEMLWTDYFLRTSGHVFSRLKRMCLFTCLWTAIPEAEDEVCPSAAMSIVHLRSVNTPVWPPEGLFRNVPHLSHFDSSIVNTSQVTSEDLNVQLTWVGVGRGPCEGLAKIQLYGQRGAIWKIQHLRKMAYMWLKITDSIFSAETVPLECKMLAQILQTAFSPRLQAVHKIPSGNPSAVLKRVAGGLRH